MLRSDLHQSSVRVVFYGPWHLGSLNFPVRNKRTQKFLFSTRNLQKKRNNESRGSSFLWPVQYLFDWLCFDKVWMLCNGFAFWTKLYKAIERTCMSVWQTIFSDVSLIAGEFKRLLIQW